MASFDDYTPYGNTLNEFAMEANDEIDDVDEDEDEETDEDEEEDEEVKELIFE